MKPYLLVLLSLVSTMISAQQVVPSVSVVGKGVVYATPDVVNISLTIENQGKDVKSLKEKNAEIVSKVIEVLMKEVPKKDFQTESVWLGKNFDYETKSYLYNVSQSIKIKLEDVKKYELLMEQIFETGVNRINSVTFDVKNKETLLREARSEAINDARQKALFYAVGLDQNIGKALTITEEPTQQIQFKQNYARLSAEMADTEQQTLALGTIAIEAKINVTFELLKE